jgi:hypothetical protein
VEIIKRSAAQPADTAAVDAAAAEPEATAENPSEISEAEKTGAQDDNN